MTVHPSHHEMLVDLTAEAVAQARLAQNQLCDVVVPMLPPQRRGLAEQIKRGLRGDGLLTESFLHDLAALVDFLERDAARGIQTGWVADEHDVHGGHHVRHYDTRAHALSCAADHLDLLHEAISDVLDFARAGRLVEGLMPD